MKDSKVEACSKVHTHVTSFHRKLNEFFRLLFKASFKRRILHDIVWDVKLTF